MIGVLPVSHLAKDQRGASAIEFALLAPLFIVMLLGVLQLGIGFQNYNALRGLTADVSRQAMVLHAQGDPMTNDELEELATESGSAAPYLLWADRLEASVEPVADQRVAGATEITLSVTYQIPSVLSTFGLNGPEIEFTKPIFLTE